MLAVKEGVFLDATIDKITIVANFKNEIKKMDFIKAICMSQMPYRLQGYYSRNFGYKEVLKCEGMDAGYIELKEDTSLFMLPDKMKLIRSKRDIEEKISFIQEGRTSQVFDLPSLEELYSSLDTIEEQLLQIDETGNLPNTDGSKKRSKPVLKDIRFEFNPKHMKYNTAADKAIRAVLEHMEDMDVTGIHLAFDYAVPISQLKIQDMSSKTENITLNRNKEIETKYIGKRGSDNQICIYNKKAENDENGSIDQYPNVEYVTRFEARLRKDKARQWTERYNPFGSLLIADLERMDGIEMKLNDRIILESILKDNEGRYWGMMDKDQKKAWRKKMKSVVPKKIDIESDYKKKKALLTNQLAELIKSAKGLGK